LPAARSLAIYRAIRDRGGAASLPVARLEYRHRAMDAKGTHAVRATRAAEMVFEETDESFTLS
jgi:hypothetical protein